MCPGPQKWPGLHASEDGELTTFPHSLLPSLGIPDHVRKSFCALSQNLPLGPGAVYRNPLISPLGLAGLNLKAQNSAALWVFGIQKNISASLVGPALPPSWDRPPVCPLLPWVF